MPANDDGRVLVLSALPVDADAVSAVAAEAGIQTQPCRDMDELCAAIREGAGAAVVSQLALSRRAFDRLTAAIHEQPEWSDFPLILVAAREGFLQPEQVFEAMRALGNVLLLEPPFPVGALVSELRAALRARRRQYETRRAGQELRESEARFRALVTASSEALYRMNPDWSEMRQLRGENFIAGTEAPDRNWLHEYIPLDEQSRVMAAIGQAIRTKSTFELENRVRRVDGSLGWAHSRAVPVLDANGEIVEWFGAPIDVTERKRAEEALRESEARERARVAELQESEERLRVLGDNLPDSFVYQYEHELDGSYRFVYCSAGIERVNGVKASEVLRDPGALNRQIPPGHMERLHQEELRSKRDLSDFDIEIPMRRPDGEERWMRIRARPRRLPDGRTVWDGVQTDITGQKKAEERRRQTQKLESIGLLARGIAHDFNNILTGVMGNASLLLEDEAPERAGLLRSIVASTERAAHLTKQLLAYSGKGQFVVQELDIAQAVNEVADLVQLSIPKSAGLSLNLDRRLPPVRMDPGQLQQILMNLVINAGEAIAEGKPGKITVTTSVADVQSPFTDELREEIAPGRYVCIEVRDTGSGVGPEERAKIFDPFFTTKFVGRGLGLAAIAGILRSQKGGIIVESEPGKGSTFRVFLPAAAKADLAVQEPEPREGRPTALVIDDEITVRKFIGAVLRRKGYQVIEASDGQEALTLLGSAPDAIDLAIVDIIMPNMSANDLLAALKARQPDMRILLTTGYSEAEARRLCSAYPGAAVIRKPYTMEQLSKAVDQLVGAAS